jgi:hypothetical protein
MRTFCANTREGASGGVSRLQAQDHENRRRRFWIPPFRSATPLKNDSFVANQTSRMLMCTECRRVRHQEPAANQDLRREVDRWFRRVTHRNRIDIGKVVPASTSQLRQQAAQSFSNIDSAPLWKT